MEPLPPGPSQAGPLKGGRAMGRLGHRSHFRVRYLVLPPHFNHFPSFHLVMRKLGPRTASTWGAASVNHAAMRPIVPRFRNPSRTKPRSLDRSSLWTELAIRVRLSRVKTRSVPSRHHTGALSFEQLANVDVTIGVDFVGDPTPQNIIRNFRGTSSRFRLNLPAPQQARRCRIPAQSTVCGPPLDRWSYAAML